jgi:hypothetical protein
MRNLTDHTVPILGRMSRQPVGIRGISVDMAAAERMQVAGYHIPFPATGFTAEQWERVRAFRFEHHIAAEAVRRLLDLGMEAVGEGLLPAHSEGQARTSSPGRESGPS